MYNFDQYYDYDNGKLDIDSAFSNFSIESEGISRGCSDYKIRADLLADGIPEERVKEIMAERSLRGRY